jgi:hypothetical protein
MLMWHASLLLGLRHVGAFSSLFPNSLEFLPKKSAETTKQKEEKRKKPKPEELEGMPQHQHCPLAKRRGDRNP